MSVEELLQAGITAARSGDRDRAASIFAQAVKADPTSDQGWYWLGLCVSAPERREYCFRRVLALNPDHIEARRELERMGKPTPVKPSAPPFSSEPPDVSQTLPPPVSPFTDQILVGEKIAPQGDMQAASQSFTPDQPRIKSKKQNKKPAWLFWSVPLVIVCCLGGGILLLSGQIMATLLPDSSIIQTPNLLPLQVTQLSTLPPTAEPPSNHLTPTALPSPKPTEDYTPLFENSSCQFDIPDGADVTCGYAIVPEDRTGDPTHTIRLAVAVYKSTNHNPAPEPVIFLQGGPGAEAVMLSAPAYDVLVAPFLPERDFIVFDQRGTGLSEPDLKCDDLTKTYLDDIHGLIPAGTRKLVYSNAHLACNGLMTVQGLNLNAYTTTASAADVRDILDVLGYEKADLFGVSYGTRLAQVIMRDHPGIVRSVILDSVVPVETNLMRQFPAGIDSALGSLFDSCAADSECNAAYPQLESVFWDLVQQLDTQPITVSSSFAHAGRITETVTGTTFMSVIVGSIKQSSLIATAPQSIYRFRNGDYSTLIAAQASMPFTFEGISPGLYISMMCHEHILTTTLEELQAAVPARQVIKDYAWLPFYGGAEDLFKTCNSWRAVGPWLGENDPVFGEISTLIITGTFDPVTPPLYGQQVAHQLSRSYYFEFPDQGHTPTVADSSGCAMRTAVAFLLEPTVEPDRSCLNALQAVDFLVPYTGNPALPLKQVEASGLSVEVPKGWSSGEEGIYFRSNSPLDATQVGIFQADIHASDLEEWFSSVASGYLGLDAAPVQAGQRQANNLAWTLFTSTSDGRPVDIAMAGYRGRSLVLMLFSNADEHNALYQTVFLPMVVSAQP